MNYLPRITRPGGEVAPHPLTVFKSVLNRITYKPGWRFLLDRQSYGYILMIVMPCEDVATQKKIDVIFTSSISDYDLDYFNEERSMSWIERQIRQAEDHEFKEWFKVDGLCRYDPHPEQRKVFADVK